ncbi:hypothetical protein [Evansella cellulosilytica]|uniref:Uncharacterized protein n=1 Tax=Evansella cellulosilytica (strain ATCC 21833 / DSM 2522 / FERM P-1141 / JCM 9156 / N-4) TaxID=649639 RepID=E6TWX6_EVAC2|nr:hypothetical protein [Evansella cellulosilytica]ADU29926.1 hypothetical protein Bcell_1663 [Evansella cellulosilytica DSM 2522]
MIVSFLLFLLFFIILGVTLGALITIKIWYTNIFFILLGIFCFGSFWIGVIIGAAFFSWLPLLLSKIAIFAFCLGLAFFFFKHYHPSYGYFPQSSFFHFIILSAFFFLIGIDFAIIGFSAWLLFLLLPVFIGTVILGAIVIMKLKGLYRLNEGLIYLPIILLLLLAFIKLI